MLPDWWFVEQSQLSLQIYSVNFVGFFFNTAKMLGAQVDKTRLESGMSLACTKLGLRSLAKTWSISIHHPLPLLGDCGQAWPGSPLLTETTHHSQYLPGHGEAIQISEEQDSQTSAASSISIKSPSAQPLHELPPPK